MKKVLIMAGGTGGHVFPGLAIAHALRVQGVDVAWLGTPKGLENTVVPKENIPLYHIKVTGLRGKGILRWLCAPYRLLRALFQAMRIIRRYQPDIAIGMGGFVSGPGGIAAWLLRKKLIIHEQNAIMGWTNRILAHFAAKVYTGFPLSKGQYVGNPVRAEISALPPPEERFKDRTGPMRLLVIGGSQGSAKFNTVVPEAVAQLSQPITVYHQCGSNRTGAACCARLGYTSTPFISDMASAYAWADLVLCRAGALTVSELSAAGVGAILVPYPHAVDDHQTANAKFLVDAGAAILLPDKDCTVNKLTTLFTKLMTDRPRLLKMAQAAREGSGSGVRHPGEGFAVLNVLQSGV